MAAIGAIAGVIGTVVSLIGTMESINAQKRAEKLRKQQMELDAARQRREVIRRGLIAQGMARNAAAAQGAQYGSGLQGGLSQITGQVGEQRTQIGQNLEIGRGIFKANMDYYGGQMLSAIGGGISSLGNGLVNISDTFNRIG